MLFAGAQAGLAQCPTRSALDEGRKAYVAYPDGSIVDLHLLSDGKVQETTRFGDHTGEFRMISLGGVFIVDEVDLQGDRVDHASRITTTYPDAVTSHLPLQPDQSFSLVAENTFADGTPAEEERIDVRSGGLAEIDIAGCTYEGFPLLLTYRWGDEHFTSMMTHLPALGLSLELARLDASADVEPFAPIHFSLEHP